MMVPGQKCYSVVSMAFSSGEWDGAVHSFSCRRAGCRCGRRCHGHRDAVIEIHVLDRKEAAPGCGLFGGGRGRGPWAANAARPTKGLV